MRLAIGLSDIVRQFSTMRQVGLVEWYSGIAPMNLDEDAGSDIVMSSTRAFWLGWSLWALCVALVLANGVAAGSGWAIWLRSLATLGMPTVGALITWRRPGNAIGWLFCALGVAWTVTLFEVSYLDDGQAARRFPGWEWVIWARSWSGNAAILGTLTFPLLLFPDGHLLSPRWRVIGWAAGITIVTMFIGAAFGPETIPDYPGIANPARLDAVAHATAVIDAPLEIVAIVVIPVLFIAPITSLALRLQRARGVERQQLKWFAYVALLVFAGSFGLAVTSMGIAALSGWESEWAAYVIFGVSPYIAIIGLPLAIGLAILRHGLYDIDHIINRTLVYGLLTVSLGTLYVALALGPTLLVGAGGSIPEWLVAASTLAVAALFHPLRSRIQALVDHRFFRSRYDAARTIEAFSSRLRDEVDLDALVVEIQAVVQVTMQPRHVSVWLRAPATTHHV